MRACARILPLLGVLLALGSGCRADQPPALLDVVTFAPSEADQGDRLEVLGNALPEGRTATLTFRGDVHQPGKDPRRVDIVAEAVGSQRRITATLSEALQIEFCGSGWGSFTAWYSTSSRTRRRARFSPSAIARASAR
jgi:hypothetical protein